MDNRLQQLIERAAMAWQVSFDEAEQLLGLHRQKTVRINPLRSKKSSKKDIADIGVALKPVDWCTDAYTVIKGYDKLSKSQLFTDGVFILQDAASFLPVLALNPKPGEAILDVCAAPGGKTTHIAALSKNKALITANDTSRARFFKMRDMFERMNITAQTTLFDGRVLRKQFADKQFDKILLDAPCSGEAAMSPDNPKSYEQWSIAKIKRLSRLQEQLLITAYDLLTPGGQLVYSTCTIAPEENEQVIQYLLKRRKAIIKPVAIAIDTKVPGLTEWNGKQLNPELANTIRLKPSQQHEAFYTALLQKPLDDSNEPDDTYYQ